MATALLATASAPASAFLANWKLNLDGGAIGNAVTVSEYLDFVGNSFIQNTSTSLTNFNFTDQGTFQITSVNGGALISTLFPGYEMTATFKDRHSARRTREGPTRGGAVSLYEPR